MKRDKKLARFQKYNCQGCWYAKPQIAGTGKPCCIYPITPVVKGDTCYSRKERPGDR